MTLPKCKLTLDFPYTEKRTFQSHLMIDTCLITPYTNNLLYYACYIYCPSVGTG
jgi:hypothetical protein